MQYLSLITATSLVLLLAQSAPAKPVNHPVKPASPTSAQAKFCEQWEARSRSVNSRGDRRAKLMAEAQQPPRKSTLGAALRELHPTGKATLSGSSDNEIVFISTQLQKGESAAISKPYGSPSYDCPNTYTLIKSVSNAKGKAFIEQFSVINLP